MADTVVGKDHSRGEALAYGLKNLRGIPFEFQVRREFKSDRNTINWRASKGLREPLQASEAFEGALEDFGEPLRASRSL